VRAEARTHMKQQTIAIDLALAFATNSGNPGG